MKFKSIWVLGSTSEIAISICIELANKGCNKFHLISRNNSDNVSETNLSNQINVEADNKEVEKPSTK